MFTPAPNLSPFDVNMAVDAGWEHCTPYTGLSLSDVAGLTQDAIFSRGPRGVRRTGIFVGGRDIDLAMQMLESARSSMVPPFEVSVLADPSGAFTTAGAMVACAEKHLAALAGISLEGRRVLVFGGTGPVGASCAILAARAGARTAIVSHSGKGKAQEVVRRCNDRYGVSLEARDGSSDELILELMADVEVIFGAAAAGVQVLSRRHLEAAPELRVACDVNAVPPDGIEGVGVMLNGVPIEGAHNGAVGIGALAVGNVKYQTQHTLLKRMLGAAGPQYLDFQQAFEVARGYA